MDEIEIFLKYPMLFQSHLRGTDTTINLVPHTFQTGQAMVLDKQGNETPRTQFMGDAFSWGSAGNTHSAQNNYRARQQSGKVTLRDTTVKKLPCQGDMLKYKLHVKRQSRIGATNESQYWSSNPGFKTLVMYDSLTMTFLDEFAQELLGPMQNFARQHAECWVSTANPRTDGNQNHIGESDTPVLFVEVDLTPERAEKLNQKIHKTWDSLIKNKISEYKVRTHESLGLYTGDAVPHVYDNPVNSNWTNIPRVATEPITANSWASAKQLNLDSEPVQIRMETGTWNLHQKFDAVVEFSKHQQCKFYAVVKWKKVQYIRNCTIETHTNGNRRFGRRAGQYRTRQNSTVWMPVVEGLVMHSDILYDKLGIDKETYSGTPINSLKTTESLSRVRDRTQKRQVRGGYRGAYQGISKIVRQGKATTFRVKLDDGLSAIASLDPIKSFTVEEQRRLPMSKEDYLEIQRPMTNVKPIEIGHLELYRISEAPRKQVTAEILSDMQLPSMPEILLAIDSDIRVTHHEGNYISGENCSGDCDKSESISMTIPPGLYVVKRKSKCALGHDPGRLEYNAGFGALCNEEITIRRLLSQLLVFYDEFRGNMVGQEANVQWSSYDDESSGSLLGRFG